VDTNRVNITGTGQIYVNGELWATWCQTRRGTYTVQPFEFFKCTGLVGYAGIRDFVRKFYVKPGV